MEDDEWLAYVRIWRESNSASAVVHSVREFAEVPPPNRQLTTRRLRTMET
jgi:hypothetical protein